MNSLITKLEEAMKRFFDMCDEMYSLICPHCLEQVFIMKADINCGKLRHGEYKWRVKEGHEDTGEEDDYEQYLEFGCGKQFKAYRGVDDKIIGMWQINDTSVNKNDENLLISGFFEDQDYERISFEGYDFNNCIFFISNGNVVGIKYY